MANFNVRFHRLAAREYHDSLSWYAHRSKRAARQFRDEILRLIHLIETVSNQGSIYQGVYRWMRFRGFPYVVYYGPIGSTDIVLYAVAHARRRPGYWRRRTRP